MDSSALTSFLGRPASAAEFYDELVCGDCLPANLSHEPYIITPPNFLCISPEVSWVHPQWTSQRPKTVSMMQATQVRWDQTDSPTGNTDFRFDTIAYSDWLTRAQHQTGGQSDVYDRFPDWPSSGLELEHPSCEQIMLYLPVKIP